MIKIQNYINGQFQDTEQTFDSINPATDEILAKVPRSTEKEADLAIASAKDAYPVWSKLKPAKRSKFLHKLADIFQSKKEDFVSLCVNDMGKTRTQASNVDYNSIQNCLRHYANSILIPSKNEKFIHYESEIENNSTEFLQYTKKFPLGVGTLITPWNFPLYMVMTKLAPCIAYGNTCVIKPSEFTSATADWFAKNVIEEAHKEIPGLPKGVINIIYGYGAEIGTKLCTDPRVSAVSFTGSSQTGGIIASNAARSLKKITMECGGKNPAVILKSADLDKTINVLLRACFSNNGQVCLNTERVYCHEDVYDQFLEKFIKATEEKYVGGQDKKLIGDPLKNETMVGPLSSRIHLEKVSKMVKTAIENGAKIENPSGYRGEDNSISAQKGAYFPPTILSNIDENFEIVQNEAFGPIACVMKFSTESEAIERANNTFYGLTAVVFSEDLVTAHRVAGKLEAGQVWINNWAVMNTHMPFGGAKQSGMGRERGSYSEEFWTEQRVITVTVDPEEEN